MQWDVVSNPMVRQNGHWGSSQAIVISSETRYPDEAWLLARKFLEKDFQVRKYPVIVPATIAAQKELDVTLRGKAPNVESMVIASHSLYRTPRIPHVLEYQQMWLDATESVWNLRLTPQDAMRRAGSDINRAMAMQRDNEP
jgi:ABC-type glycerol-3-phosphate transport system substrate-binding protein